MTTAPLRLAALSAAAALLVPAGASACGGLFCNGGPQFPVVQRGERIVFDVAGERVTAHIQIQYQGLAEDFSWVLPLPEVPEVRLGTTALFTALTGATDPVFQLEWQASACDVGCDPSVSPPPMMDASVQTMDAGSSGGGVTVLDQGTVGSFEYQVVEASEGAEDDAVFDWLATNGYDQPDAARPIVKHYANSGFRFVAVKLKKNAEVGDIQPIVLEYDAPTFACVPLRLTSIAATPDLPVTTWILAEARAIPMNYLHVLLNPVGYDWLRCAQQTGQRPGCGWAWTPTSGICQQEYVDLVTAAADEAGGRAFVTEFAGASSVMSGRVWAGAESIAEVITGTEPQGVITEAVGAFGVSTVLFGILAEFVPNWSTCSDLNFYGGAPFCSGGPPEDYAWDRDGLFAALQERVLDPLVQAQALFEARPYLTRLATTISPEEMTLDPLFSFNPDLGDVDNVHVASAQPLCAEGEGYGTRLTFPDDSFVEVEGTFGVTGFVPASDSTAGQPAAGVIQVMQEQGAATVVGRADVPGLSEEIATRAPTPGASERPREGAPEEPGLRSPTPGERIGDEAVPPAASGGCTAGPSGPPATGWLWGLGLGLMLWVGRRTGLRN